MVPKKPECPSNELVKDPLSGLAILLPVIIMLTLVLSVLVGCGATPVSDADFQVTPVTFNVKVAYQCGQPAPVIAVVMRDINWEIIEVEDLVFDEGADPFTGELVTLTVDDYKALGANTTDWATASKGMKDQRNFYRDCIERSQEEIQSENEE